MMVWSAVLLLLWTTTSYALQPIFPDQLGETDWRIDSLAGTIKNSLQVEEHTFVSTSASELARLDKHGNFDWFVKLQDAEISNIMTYKRSLFTFSNTDNLLRLWNTVDGTLLWDCFLGYKLDSNGTTVGTSSISLDVANQVITVLSDNCLSFVHAKGVLMWQWCAVDVEGGDGTHVVLSQLINPTSTTAISGGAGGSSSSAATENSRKNTRGGGLKVAIGCVVRDTDALGACAQTAVILVNYNTQHVYMDTFAGLPTTPQNVHSVINSATSVVNGADNEDDYAHTDVIFGVIHATANSAAEVRLIELHSSGAVQEGDDVSSVVTMVLTAEMLGIPTAASAAVPQTAVGFVVAPFPSTSTAAASAPISVRGHPGVTVCSSTASCRTFFAVRTSEGAWSLTPVLYCDATAVTSSAAAAAVVGYQQHPLISYNGASASSPARGLVLATTCSRIVQARATGVNAGSSPAGLTFTAHVAGFARESSSSVIAPLPSTYSYSLTGGVQAVFPHIATSSTASSAVRVLAVGSAGVVFVVGGSPTPSTSASASSASPTAVAAASVLWSKEHGISHIRQVVVLDHSHSASGPSAATAPDSGDEDDDDEDAIPELRDRLKMQQAEVMDVLHRAVYAVQHPLETVAAGGGAIVNRIRGVLLQSGAFSNEVLDDMPIFAAAAASRGVGGRRARSAQQLSKDNKLGFRKLAICLSLVPVAGHHADGLVKIRLVGVDLSARAIAWSIEPELSSVSSKSATVKLLSAFASSHMESTGKDHFELLVSTDKQTTVLSLTVPAATSHDHSSDVVTRVHIEKHVITNNEDPSSRVISVVPGVAPPATAATPAASSDTSSHSSKQYVLLWSDYRASVYVPFNNRHHHAVTATASTVEPGSGSISKAYSNLYANVWVDATDANKCVGVVVDRGGSTAFNAAATGSSSSAGSGIFQVVRVNTTSCTRSQQKHGITHTCGMEVVSSLNFDEETVVGVTGHAAGDVAHTRATVLGDDSVLLKSLNAHRILITTATPTQAAASFADMSYTSTSTSTSGSGSDDPSAVSSPKATLELLPSSVFLTLIDSASGKILYRSEVPSATAPVHSVLIENQIVVSYWNTVAKRSELLSMTLYEGMIDKHSLVPGANKPAINRANLNPDGSRTVSSFTQSPPVAQFKTFILPRSVTAMGHSVPARGISHKNVLLGLNTHQLYALDLRHVSPRRPANAPTQQEKEEGLQQYQPYLTLHPTNMITYNSTLLGAVTAVHSFPTSLESSSIVFATSTNGIYCNRIMPSNGFDIMPSDFNHALLVLILAAMAGVVAMLRLMYRKKMLAGQWV